MKHFDIVIKNGYIVDGSGNPGFYGDLAIKGDEIVQVAGKIDGSADRVLDAQGHMVCPGLIDPHVHEETVVLYDGDFEVFLRQGVTTTINGNCGHSITPGSSKKVYEYFNLNGLISEDALPRFQDEQPEWTDFEGFVDVVRKKGTNINLGFLIGHGTIRWAAMNGSHDRPPSKDEEADILRYIEEGMKQGALGLSTGLAYIPSRYANTDEVVKCAEIVAEYDGIYATHARYYLGILESTLEAIEIGKRANVRVQVSHLTPVSGDSFDAILKARREGVEIAVDTIPKSTGHCIRKDRLYQFISAVTSELFDGKSAGVKKALQTKEGRALVKQNQFIFSHGMDKVLLVNTGDAALEGKTIAQIAKERGVSDEEELLLDFLADDAEYTFWVGGPSRGDFPVGPHSENIIKNPLVMVGTDTIFSEPWDPSSWYELQRRGGFPIFFKMYMDAGVPVEEIVRRNTSFAAQHFRLMDRGLLRAGMKADIAVIDLENYSYPSAEQIDYTDPLVCAKGVEHVIVNGVLTLDGGKVKKEMAGRVLLRDS